MSTIELNLPKDIMRSMKLPPGEIEKEIRMELAVALYARGVLSMGKARKLAGMTLWEFQRALGKYRISRHYDTSDLEDDLQYARRGR